MHEVQILSMNNKYNLEVASRTIHHFRLNAIFSFNGNSYYQSII